MRVLCSPAHGVAVTMPHTVALVHKVQMRVNLHEVHGRLIIKRTDTGDIDRMISPQHHRQRTGSQKSPYPCFYTRMAALGIGVDDVCIAHIHNATALSRQIDAIILMIIRARMAKCEQG